MASWGKSAYIGKIEIEGDEEAMLLTDSLPHNGVFGP
jgi:hypothetical protein